MTAATIELYATRPPIAPLAAVWVSDPTVAARDTSVASKPPARTALLRALRVLKVLHHGTLGGGRGCEHEGRDEQRNLHGGSKGEVGRGGGTSLQKSGSHGTLHTFPTPPACRAAPSQSCLHTPVAHTLLNTHWRAHKRGGGRDGSERRQRGVCSRRETMVAAARPGPTAHQHPRHRLTILHSLQSHTDTRIHRPRAQKQAPRRCISQGPAHDGR
jgi:hypothetical protein